MFEHSLPMRQSGRIAILRDIHDSILNTQTVRVEGGHEMVRLMDLNTLEPSATLQRRCEAIETLYQRASVLLGVSPETCRQDVVKLRLTQ